MAKTMTIELPDDQVERLQRLARRLRRTQEEAGARLIDEALRVAEFALITFRDSAVGRQAYIQGAGLAVWEVMMLLRERGGDVQETADYLSWPIIRVQAAAKYAAAFPHEIDAALSDNDSYDEHKLRAVLPQTRVSCFNEQGRLVEQGDRSYPGRGMSTPCPYDN